MAAKVTGTKARTPARQSLPPPPRNAEEAAGTAVQARSPAASSALPDGTDEALDASVQSFEPVRLTKARKNGPQVTLFYVDDVPYKVPATPRMDIGLEAIELAITHPLGQLAAERFVFLAMLGADGYKAFRESVETPEDYAKVSAILTRLTVGAVEPGKE